MAAVLLEEVLVGHTDELVPGKPGEVPHQNSVEPRALVGGIPDHFLESRPGFDFPAERLVFVDLNDDHVVGRRVSDEFLVLGVDGVLYVLAVA